MLASNLEHGVRRMDPFQQLVMLKYASFVGIYSSRRFVDEQLHHVSLADDCKGSEDAPNKESKCYLSIWISDD